jgi:Copper transport outer membrane protein, MctB
VFDFRYHALSLVAVFLALGIGIVLGASLGDSVVSQANKDVRSALRGDLLSARNDARTAKQAVANRDAFISAAFDRLAGGRLRHRRIAVVSSGDLPQGLESDVRDTVGDAGGQVESVSEFDADPNLLEIGGKLGGRFQLLGTNPGQLRPLARRMGRQLVRGGRAARKLEAAFPDAFSGDFRRADAVVFFRSDDERNDQSDRFEAALIEGVRQGRVPVVGVERSDEDVSQIPFYVKAGLSTVDDVDQPAGRIALVLTLAGAKGNYGFKDTADNGPLPLPRAGRTR